MAYENGIEVSAMQIRRAYELFYDAKFPVDMPFATGAVKLIESMGRVRALDFIKSMSADPGLFITRFEIATLRDTIAATASGLLKMEADAAKLENDIAALRRAYASMVAELTVIDSRKVVPGGSSDIVHVARRPSDVAREMSAKCAAQYDADPRPSDGPTDEEMAEMGGCDRVVSRARRAASTATRPARDHSKKRARYAARVAGKMVDRYHAE